ncbi:NusG domain II-containing protein [Gammaproteobacteria bacterium AB-CW1]|uniref:NusG domain II-containing protein n=1 Tax=Natronospira elongata TaxID=3110268 RepID=A0AAP6JE11_9GAMM|nr:NusG domain II-containing protein [Gammaproteobacteria bacterium AB-CW1]
MPRPSLLDCLVILILAASLGLLLAMSLDGRSGDTALVMAEDTIVKRINLSRAGEYTVSGPLGESLLEVSNGRIRFADAPCPDRICLRRGWLSQHGDSATCIPNRVHIRLEAEENGYDSINF